MFSRIFQVKIYEFFHHYFSAEKENKFLIGQKIYFFSVLITWANQNKYVVLNNIWYNLAEKNRRFVLGKFVKTCRELDLNNCLWPNIQCFSPNLNGHALILIFSWGIWRPIRQQWCRLSIMDNRGCRVFKVGVKN